MIKIYVAPTVKPRFALLVDDRRELVSQVYTIPSQNLLTTVSQVKLPSMMALHTKQTQLLANENYWLWPIDESTNQFPSITENHLNN